MKRQNWVIAAIVCMLIAAGTACAADLHRDSSLPRCPNENAPELTEAAPVSIQETAPAPSSNGAIEETQPDGRNLHGTDLPRITRGPGNPTGALGVWGILGLIFQIL